MNTVLIQEQTIHLRNAACPIFETKSKKFSSGIAVLTEGDGANEKDKLLVGRQFFVFSLKLWV